MRKLVSSVGALLLSGCTLVPHTVQPDVAPQVTASTIGAGHRVNLVVVDDRPEQDIGNRGYVRSARVHLGGDLVALTKAGLVPALQAKGFTFGDDSPKTLRVEVRDLTYSENQGALTVGSKATAAIKATVTGGTTSFEKMYRASAEGKGLAAAGSDKITERVNSALNNALTQMLEDPQLLTALTAELRPQT